MYQQGQEQYLELIPAPRADILYTTDGSDPRGRGAPYAGPFPVPKGTRLVQAVAGRSGVESELLRIDTGAGPKTIDPERPLTWKARRLFQNLPTSQAYQLVERLLKFNGTVRGLEIYYMTADQDEELQYTVAESLPRTGAELSALLERITGFFARGNLVLTVHRIGFERGQAYLDWQNQDRLAVDLEKEIEQ